MTRLLKVELTRMMWRRAVLVLVGLAVVIPIVIGVGTAFETRPPSPDALANAERQAEQESQSKWVQRDLKHCVAKPERYLGDTPTDVQAACEEAVLPRADWYIWFNPLDLAEQRDAGSGVAVVVVVAILMLLAGTTFAGHDWASGSVGNQLLFEPRRVRVWAAKALAVTAVAGAVAAFVVTSYWLALFALARSRDIAVADGVLLDCLQMGWRGAGVAAGCALAGYALTMLLRSTVATLGILLALGLAGGLILAAVGIESVWNPGLNLLAVVLDGSTYWVEGPCPDGMGGCSVERTLSLERGLTFCGVLLTAGVAASLVSFRQRDVA